MSTKWNDILIRKALNDTGVTPYTGGTCTPRHYSERHLSGTQSAASIRSQDLQCRRWQTHHLHAAELFLCSRQESLPAPTPVKSTCITARKTCSCFRPCAFQNQLKTSSHQDYVQVVANDVNEVTVTPEPFTFLPTSETHSCLIARVSTPNHPNPLPQDGEIGTMAQLANYIASHPNMGWRNVALVNKGIPSYTNYFTLDTTCLKPGTEYLFLVGLSYKGLTPAASWPSPPAPPSPRPGQRRRHSTPTHPVDQADGSFGTRYLTIPAGFKTSVSFTYTAKPPIQQGWSLQFFAVYLPLQAAANSDDQTARDLAIPVHEHGIPGLHLNHPCCAWRRTALCPASNWAMSA